MPSGRAFGPVLTSRSWRPFSVYDFEWVPETYEFRVGGVYDGNSYRSYRSVGGFLDGELTASTAGLWYFAHYGGMADINFILPELVKRGSYSARGASSGSSVICATIKRGRYSWHLLDSFWLLKDSLAKIGKWIGEPKGDPWKRLCNESCEADCRKHAKEWYAEAPMAELIEYNRQDCITLWQAIKQFQMTLLDLGGSLKRTQAACAMDLFRRKYLKTEIHTSASINQVAREAYTASRVEVIESTCEQGNYYDINSSFPYAMTFAQPGSFLGWHETLPDRLMYEPDNTPFLVDVTILVPEVYIPPLPYRHEGRVFFPTGKWRAWMSSVDLMLAARAGARIMRIHEVLEFEPFYDLSDYATDLYRKRAAASSDSFERIAYKFLLNSLYGKFGEKGEKQTIWINPPPNVIERLNWESDCKMPGVWIETSDRAVVHEHVPISVNITAIGRRTIYNHIVSGPDVYYLDTDGFCTTGEFPTGEGLGQLKLEKQIADGRWIAPKLYDYVDTKTGKRVHRAKGFTLKNDAQKFENLLAGYEVEIDRMVRVREAIVKRDLSPREATIVKRLQNNVPKRFTYPDGTTRPWAISEIQSMGVK
jgi:hypothetical protein